MGYFPNGTAGEIYRDRFCSRCIHGHSCTVWLVHMLFNYEECNKPESILHHLIPISKQIPVENEQCTMFVEDQNRPDPNQGELFDERED